MKKLILLLILFLPVVSWASSAGMLPVGGVTVVAAGGGYTPKWKYNGDHTFTSSDPTENNSAAQYMTGGLITAPTGSTKITKIRGYWSDSTGPQTVLYCVYNSAGSTLVGSGTGTLPGTSTGFFAVDTSTLNLGITAGQQYLVLMSGSTNLEDEYYYATGTGKYYAFDYTGTCPATVTASDDANQIHGVGVYFE